MSIESENESLLLGVWRYLVPIPRPIWQGEVGRSAQSGRAGLAFMSIDHHRVRDFTVRELPRCQAPLAPGLIAEKLNLPLGRVVTILDDLEKHLTFVFRNEQGAVTWAYPVTVDHTPHRVTFSTGEVIYAA